jgi:chemotaxis protein methyltransferase WspC
VKRIEQLLNREIGLAPNSIGAKAIELAVRARMGTCRATSVDAYLGRLSEPDERRALVEEIVVSETWFFRDEEVFRALASFAVARQRATLEATLRVLCMPCATGEEAYSAAITLLEAGLEPSQFSVHGFDVSERALEVARAGVYRKNSFRSAQRPESARYFETVPAGSAVSAETRSSVMFERGNILDPLVAHGGGKFDVVFCRNLLIYLDHEARARALTNINGWLAKGGVLFGGHAEAIEAMDPRFVRREGTCHCAYGRRSELERAPAETPRAARVRSARGSAIAGAPPVASRTRPQRTASEMRAPEPKGAPVLERPSRAASLEAVETLANRADPEADAACQRHIAEHGPSPDAYCLLGLIRQAAGAEQAAIDCFNKALYLDQSHYGALIHLVLVHERRQEPTLASNFRRRAELAKSKRARP